jgi:hypothetical protein
MGNIERRIILVFAVHIWGVGVHVQSVFCAFTVNILFPWACGCRSLIGVSSDWDEKAHWGAARNSNIEAFA